jgi:hypothetical protein
MYYSYNGYYFKLKALRDYNYLSKEELTKFKWNIIKNLYNYLQKKDKLQLFNELTNISIKQQNELILKSIMQPKPYLHIYNENQN